MKTTLVPEPAELLISHLNEKADRRFAMVEEHLRLVRKCLQDCSNDIDGAKRMIDRQVALWKNTDMEPWLRPATLFARKNFRNYYDDRDMPLPNRFRSTGASKYSGSPSIPEQRNQFIPGSEDIKRAIAAESSNPGRQPWEK